MKRATKVSLGWRNLPDERDQYAYRILAPGDSEPAWRFGNGLSIPFDDSLCYTLELQRLVDGVVHRYDERCVQRPAAFGELGVFPQDPSVIAGLLLKCPSPPNGYEMAWCDAIAPTCEKTPTAYACAAYARRCNPTAGTAGSGGMASGGKTGSGGATATGGSSTPPGNAGAAADDPEPYRLAGTCAYSTPGRNPAPAAFGLLALAGVLLGTRRQSARRRPR